MNWIIIETIITIVLLIVIGIPFMIAFIIPLIVYSLGGKSKIPTLDYLIKYFNVDVTQKPYSEWMDKHPVIFVSLTSIELYASYWFIHILRPFKTLFKKLKGDKNDKSC